MQNVRLFDDIFSLQVTLKSLTDFIKAFQSCHLISSSSIRKKVKKGEAVRPPISVKKESFSFASGIELNNQCYI